MTILKVSVLGEKRSLKSLLWKLYLEETLLKQELHLFKKYQVTALSFSTKTCVRRLTTIIFLFTNLLQSYSIWSPGKEEDLATSWIFVAFVFTKWLLNHETSRVDMDCWRKKFTYGSLDLKLLTSLIYSWLHWLYLCLIF